MKLLPFNYSLSILLLILFASAIVAAEFRCDSNDGEQHHCKLLNANKMKVKLKMDHSGLCSKGQTWGVDGEGVWVDMDCKATFSYKPQSNKVGWRKFLPF